MTSTPAPRATLTAALAGATPAVRATLEGALAGEATPRDAAHALGEVTGADLEALVATADELRHRQVGEAVTYVVNRNINFTNVCVKSCKFCAFSRDSRSEQGYFLSTAQVVALAVEARDLGATEVCLQAGLAPGIDGRLYVEVTRAVKQAAPELHLHAWSPEEVKYGARLARVSIRDYLAELRDAGLGSLPGTSAEVLDQGVRDVIAPGRITVAEWVEVITSAHALGIPTTSTLMFGHVETPAQRVEHLLTLRRLQAETGGFTEFVPLAFIHAEAPLFLGAPSSPPATSEQVARSLPGAVSAGPSRDDVLRLFALSRLVLGASIPHLQASWVKHGPAEAAALLHAGADDLGGTLINESISTMAGAQHGQLMTPATLRGLIHAEGRVPVERDTRYRALERFDPRGDDAGQATQEHPLDAAARQGRTFGSYGELAADARLRFRVRRRSATVAAPTPEPPQEPPA